MAKKMTAEEELGVVNATILALEDYIYRLDTELDKLDESYKDLAARKTQCEKEREDSGKKKGSLVARRQKLCKVLGYDK